MRSKRPFPFRVSRLLPVANSSRTPESLVTNSAGPKCPPADLSRCPPPIDDVSRPTDTSHASGLVPEFCHVPLDHLPRLLHLAADVAEGFLVGHPHQRLPAAGAVG